MKVLVHVNDINLNHFPHHIGRTKGDIFISVEAKWKSMTINGILRLDSRIQKRSGRNFERESVPMYPSLICWYEPAGNVLHSHGYAPSGKPSLSADFVMTYCSVDQTTGHEELVSQRVWTQEEGTDAMCLHYFIVNGEGTLPGAGRFADAASCTA